ncbi:hypothetical protein JCM3765_004988 [Sporobolomyces pararoseus]
MAAAPATPTRTRVGPKFVDNNPLLKPAMDPTKPSTRSSTKLAVPTTSGPFNPSLPSAPPSRASSISTSTRNLAGWKEEEGVNIVVEAKHHERRLSKYCSWLHCFEHARYLHAGLPQGAIDWPDYPTRTTEETPLMRNIHRYLSSRTPYTYVRQPDPSLETAFPEVESKEELQAAYKTGAIHFTGDLSVVKDSRDGQRRVVFKLSPPSAGMGSHLFRKWGSDRFLRIKLDDDALRSCGPSFGPEIPCKTLTLREQLQSFFRYPLRIFGRQYSPFCAKDGAVIYFAEKGTGIQKEDERTLVQFAQEYLDAQLNPRMSAAKYCARFELGLTTTTPTVTFPRHRVLRTPDLKSDSLKISVAMMQHLKHLFIKTFPSAPTEFLPDGYLPSCIRGLYGSVDDDNVMTPMVWQLDYSSDAEATRFIHVHQSSTKPSKPARLYFRFSIVMKDGSKRSLRYRVPSDQLRWEAPWRAGGKRGVDMTDGCSLMSCSSMKIVAEQVAEAGGAIEMTPSIPPVAQGRIGPGKGVWGLAPFSSWNSNDPEQRWIEVRDSQWKFEDKRTETFTFELHSVPSTKAQSAKLGKQMFEVLSHCGVPNAVFREMLRNQVQTSQKAFWDPHSMPALLYHVEKSCGIIEDRTLKAKLASDPSNIKFSAFDSTKIDDDLADVGDQQQMVNEGDGFVHDKRLDPFSAAPNTVPEVVVQMLQNGFEPSKNAHLAAKLKIVSSLTLEKQLSFKVDDEYSRTAFVIADHMGVLEEGEFFFQCSEPLPTNNGFGKVGIVDGYALLSRSPAVQPCDVQKVRGVYRPEYRMYYDVIIVSTKGDRSLCSILSGGDYDGDKLICMTNPALVNPFVNADHEFADPPFEDSDWFNVDRRRVGDCVTPLVTAGDNERLAGIFLESLFVGAQYGMLSKYHTTLAYKLGIADPLTSEVGHLFCRALDGRKQGLSFSSEKWQLAKHKFFDPHKDVPAWTYAEDGRHPGQHEKFAVRPKKLGRHPMDELDRERTKVKRITDSAWVQWCRDRVIEIDDDLSREWNHAWELGLKQRGAFFEDLERILSHVKTIFQEYKNLLQRWAREKDNGKLEIERSNAPGSPTKRSPSKKSTEWKSSSKNQKEELLALTKRFWGIIDASTSPLRSEKLTGNDGARYARALIASCAYIEPLQPTVLPPPVGCPTLIDRFRNAISSQVSSSLPSATPPTSKADGGTSTIATTSTPLEEDEFDKFYGDTRWSDFAGQSHWSSSTTEKLSKITRAIETFPRGFPTLVAAALEPSRALTGYFL